MRRKWRTFVVSTEKPIERAVAPIRRSGERDCDLAHSALSVDLASDIRRLLRIRVDRKVYEPFMLMTADSIFNIVAELIV